jgi:hypothetical protein
MQTPQPSPAPRPTFILAGPPGTQPVTLTPPRTARDIEALKARREELSNQLQSVDSRRSKLMSQLKQTGDQTAIKGLEDRLALLDSRQLQLETDIAQTGQQLTSAPAGLIATSAPAAFYGVLSSNQVMGLSVLSIIFVLSPLAIGFGRSILKRSNKPGIPPQVLTETAQRLEHLESSVDAIAIEIERISEGQRFVTKLLSDGQAAPMLGSGQRSPESVRAGSVTK